MSCAELQFGIILIKNQKKKIGLSFSKTLPYWHLKMYDPDGIMAKRLHHLVSDLLYVTETSLSSGINIDICFSPT